MSEYQSGYERVKCKAHKKQKQFIINTPAYIMITINAMHKWNMVNFVELYKKNISTLLVPSQKYLENPGQFLLADVLVAWV